jgi:DNA polymerase-4
MRENGFETATLKISVRDNELVTIERQMKLARPTNLTSELVPAAMELFKKHYRWYKPVRSLGICGNELITKGSFYRLNLFDDEEKRDKRFKLECSVDKIRNRFGHHSLQRAVLMRERLKSVNANNDIGDAQTFYAYH